MHRGYLKLWRKCIDTAVFVNPHIWKLWCLCLVKAGHKHCFVDAEGRTEPVKLNPGQFITGRFSLHSDYYPNKKKENKSPRTVWRWLQTLENLENLTIKSYSKFSVITVENWHLYQQRDQQTTNRRPTRDQPVTTNKNVKNVKNKQAAKKYSVEFEKFWKEYPRKRGKNKAFISWEKYNCGNGLFDLIMSSLEKQKQDPQWQKDNGQYIPYGSTWVKGRGWEDEIETNRGSEWE